MHQGLIRVCSKPVVVSEVSCLLNKMPQFFIFFGNGLPSYTKQRQNKYRKLFFLVSLSLQDAESSQVRTGNWKIPLSQNYLPLYKGLLDCDQLKVLFLFSFFILILFVACTYLYSWKTFYLTFSSFFFLISYFLKTSVLLVEMGQ